MSNTNDSPIPVKDLESLVAVRMLRCARSMAKIITQICGKHGLDLTHVGGRLRLELEGYEPLGIQVTGKHLVAVAHYYYQNGDAVADPEIVFWTGLGDERWIPVEITQPPLGLMVGGKLHELGGWQPCAEVRQGGLVRISFDKVSDVCKLAKVWASNLRDQGWLKNGVNTNPPKPWQVTLEVWRAREHVVERDGRNGRYLRGDGTAVLWKKTTNKQAVEKQHRWEVQFALSNGEDVPAHVLACYPDLHPGPEQAFEGVFEPTGVATDVRTPAPDEDQGQAETEAELTAVGEASDHVAEPLSAPSWPEAEPHEVPAPEPAAAQAATADQATEPSPAASRPEVGADEAPASPGVQTCVGAPAPGLATDATAPVKRKLPEGVSPVIEVDAGRNVGWRQVQVIRADARWIHYTQDGRRLKVPLAGRDMVWKPVLAPA